MDEKTKHVSEFQMGADYGPSLFSVPAVLKVVWCLVLFYSLLCQWLLDSKWYAMVVYYFIGLGAFYIWHWQSHHHFFWNTSCYNHHMNHHFKIYPPHRFFGNTKEPQGNEDKSFIQWLLKVAPYPGYTSISHEIVLYALGVLIFGISFFVRVSTKTMIGAFFGYGIMAFVANYLHEAFHEDGHVLEQYNWFWELRKIHYFHHKGSAKQNYAILNVDLDKFFHSYQVDISPQAMDMKFLTTFLIRSIIIAFFMALWFETQSLISTSGTLHVDESGIIIDRVHLFLEPLHSWFLQNPNAAMWTTFASSLVIDILGVSMLLISVFGKSFRPFLSISILFIMRQICQFLVLLPAPSQMIWKEPKFDACEFCSTSLFVTYATENDFFFSGHTAMAAITGIEFIRMLPKGTGWKVFGISISLLIIIFEAGVVLVFRSHWSMDVIAALFAARYSSLLSARHCDFVDSLFP